MSENEILREELWQLCQQFIQENEISDEDDYPPDSLNVQYLIEDIGNLVGWHRSTEM
jgi:hypothetical protein